MLYKFFILILILPLIIQNCSSSHKISSKKLNKILSKNTENWTRSDCETIISAYTKSNLGNNIQNITSLSYSSKKVFIKVVPLNLVVLQAKTGIAKFDRRLDEDRYRTQLKEKLEFYTNLTLDIQTGKIKPRELPADYQKEFTFEVYFENISNPHQVIEVDGAYEGFFLENENNQFGRVVGISGYFADEYFILDGSLRVNVTFSCIDDKGKDIFTDPEMKAFSLVFNGLDSKPIVIHWNFYSGDSP
jgi:hypothetical protein